MAKYAKPYAPKKKKSRDDDERLPSWEQLVNAVKEADFYLGFAKDYIHNGHLKGATDALKSIKRVTANGLKIRGVENGR